jgi:hypothetical protein
MAWVVPVDGCAARQLDCPVGGGFNSAAVSPTGRRVAAATFFGRGEFRLCVWDLETGALRHFELPGSGRAETDRSPGRTGYERGVMNLTFAGEHTVFTAGDGGLRRWNLETGSHELVAASAPGYTFGASFSADARVALTAERRMGKTDDCRQALLHDLPMEPHGRSSSWDRAAAGEP